MNDQAAVTDVDEVVEGTGVELEVGAPPTALFRTTDPVEVVTKATEVADALADVIQRKGLFTQIQGKSHVRVEGWQLLGSMLGVTAVCVETEPVEGGYKATVEARATDGRVVGRADALCTKQEKRGPWKSADDYARLSMAQTRATSKALKGPLGFIVSLAGYETTPSEEMTFVEPDTPNGGGRPAEGSDTPSAKQLDYLVSLLAKAKVSSDNLEVVRAWGRTNLTGKKGGTCSRAIEALKSGEFDRVAETVHYLLEKSGEWAAKQPDVPADREGLPSEPDPEPLGDLES